MPILAGDRLTQILIFLVGNKTFRLRCGFESFFLERENHWPLWQSFYTFASSNPDPGIKMTIVKKRRNCCKQSWLFLPGERACNLESFTYWTWWAWRKVQKSLFKKRWWVWSNLQLTNPIWSLLFFFPSPLCFSKNNQFKSGELAAWMIRCVLDIFCGQNSSLYMIPFVFWMIPVGARKNVVVHYTFEVKLFLVDYCRNYYLSNKKQWSCGPKKWEC